LRGDKVQHQILATGKRVVIIGGGDTAPIAWVRRTPACQPYQSIRADAETAGLTRAANAMASLADAVAH